MSFLLRVEHFSQQRTNRFAVEISAATKAELTGRVSKSRFTSCFTSKGYNATRCERQDLPLFVTLSSTAFFCPKTERFEGWNLFHAFTLRIVLFSISFFKSFALSFSYHLSSDVIYFLVMTKFFLKFLSIKYLLKNYISICIISSLYTYIYIYILYN